MRLALVFFFSWLATAIIIIVIGILLHPYLAHASDTVEVVTGGITYHIIDDGSSIKNDHKLSDDGRLIVNPLLGVNYSHTSDMFYQSYATFLGKNSIDETMYGFLLQSGLEADNKQLGLVAGAYFEGNRQFVAKGMQPFRLGTSNGTDVIPLLGIAFNYKIMLTDRVFMRLNNIMTPIVFNSNVSLGLEF